MFRFLSLSHRLISMSMPFVFLLAWVACIATCTEASENNKGEDSTWAPKGNSKIEIVETSHCSENCFLTNPAAFQERQNVIAPAPLVESAAVMPSTSLVSVQSVPASDINQNSPPKKTPPLFLLLCNFRI